MSEQIYGIHAVNSILTHSPERLIEEIGRAHV